MFAFTLKIDQSLELVALLAIFYILEDLLLHLSERQSLFILHMAMTMCFSVSKYSSLNPSCCILCLFLQFIRRDTMKRNTIVVLML